MLKVPLGTWALSSLEVGATLGRLALAFTKKEQETGVGRAEAQRYRADRADELVLLLPAVVLVVFVSSQTGISRHCRYVLPAFPVHLDQQAAGANEDKRLAGRPMGDRPRPSAKGMGR